MIEFFIEVCFGDGTTKNFKTFAYNKKQAIDNITKEVLKESSSPWCITSVSAI